MGGRGRSVDKLLARTERPCPYLEGRPPRCTTMRDCPGGMDCPETVRATRGKTVQSKLEV
jgi:phage FluMu protein Com